MNETTSTPATTTEEAPTNAATPKAKSRRGFAAMDREKVREIASKGGKAAHVQGTAHQFTSEEARAAGKKGGVAPHVRRGRGVPKAKPEDGETKPLTGAKAEDHATELSS